MANFTSTHTGSVVDAAVTKITATSSSATELNILDGVTATTAEINILDGVTATTAEINILDGVTATAAEINILDGVTSTTAELNILDGVTSTAAELNILDGVTSTAAELNVLDGYTGSVTELNYLDTLHATGVTATEFDYLDGVTSNIQTQLDAKIEATLTSEQVQDIVGAMFSSNTESGITVSYEDGDGTIDLTVATQSDNNFTTTLLNKLNAIEASADVTDTANVTSAGALMDSEVSNLSFVKGLTKGISDGNVLTANDAVADNDFLRIDGTEVEGRTAAEVRSDLNVEDGATADQTASEIKTLVGNASDSNVFTDADHSKLDGIEASADVTDATNVTAAGALMDSELTSIADVKALDQSVISGASPTFGTANMTDASNKRFMTDAQETKLDSVESNATADQTDEEIQDIVGAMFSSNTETGITATYQDGDGTIDLVVGTLNQDTTGTAAKVTVSDSTANTNFPVVFHDESNALLDDTGALRYNPSTGELLVPKLTVAGTTTQVDTVTMEAANAIIFEGATADAHETTLSIVDPTADHTQYLINQGGYIPVLAAATTTAITSTPAELNVLDGITSTTAELNILDGVTSTAAELNILDGVTATAAELNIMDGVTATTAELNYVDGVTSNIQTQLDATLDTAGTGIDISSTTISVDVSDFMTNGADNRIVTATGTDAMNAEANLTFDGTDLAIAATGKISFDAGGHTFIDEQSDDNLRFRVGAQNMMIMQEGDTDFVRIPDNVRLSVGTGDDLQISHNATNSYIQNYTGDLYFQNHTTDGDVHFLVDDGGGNDITAIQIDASNIGRVILPNDNQHLAIGVGQDLRLYHSGTDSYLQNNTGTYRIDQTAAAMMMIRNTSSDQDFYISVNDGGSQINALQIDASEAGSVFMPNDNATLGIGAGNDLRLFHDGTNSYIYNYQGELRIGNTVDDADTVLYGDDGSGGVTAYLTLDGSAGTVEIPKQVNFGAAVTGITGFYGASNTFTGYNNTYNFKNASSGDMMSLTSTGLGIGTTSPEGKLHIYNGDASVAPDGDADELVVENSSRSGISILSGEGSTDTGAVIFGSANDAFGAGLQYSYHGNSLKLMTANTGHSLIFSTDNNSEAMRINSSGNVGVGTAILDAGAKFSVVSGSSAYTAHFSRHDADDGLFLHSEAESTHYNWLITTQDNVDKGFEITPSTGVGNRTFSTPAFVIKADTGTVGIGTNSPTFGLQIDGSNFSGDSLKITRGTSAFTILNANNSYGVLGMESNHDLQIRTNGTTRMTIDNSGNVGIGETSIDANLHITGSPVVVKLERVGQRAMRFGTPDNSAKFIFADSDDLKSNIAIEIDSSRDVKITESVGIGVAANGTAGRLDCSNDVVAFASSDKRLKENIKPLNNALDKINKINGVEFDWKELTEEEKKTVHGNTGHDVGVIAQEIEEVLPEVVTTRDTGYKAVKYEKIVPLLIQAIKEQQQQIEELKNG